MSKAREKAAEKCECDLNEDPETPEGYLEWHSWAAIQNLIGRKQTKCQKCGLWYYSKPYVKDSK